MSGQLLKKIAESKEKAKNSGIIIELRKNAFTKNDQKKSKISYKWYQTPTKVGIQIPYIVENKQSLVVKFTKKTATIDFPIKQGGNYHLDLELYQIINTAKSKKVHRLDSIEIIMEKQEQTHWLSLRKDGQTLPQAEEKQDINYPSSAKNKRNWDKIGKQLDRDIQRHAEDYGEDPGMEFFKQIFRNADPEKRKAMMKSFQTSGGTVLSTDWGDVSKKDYQGKDRPSPPKGQQWRKRQY